MNLEDTKVATMFEEDIDKLVNDLNLVISTHNKQVEKIEELQQRIDKAIEYIEHEKFCDKYGNFVVAIGEDNGCPEEACEKLLKILKGKSE